MSKIQEQVIELTEQVDAAQGAEEMVEHLTEKTLQQEERITELEEEKSDLVRADGRRAFTLIILKFD